MDGSTLDAMRRVGEVQESDQDEGWRDEGMEK